MSQPVEEPRRPEPGPRNEEGKSLDSFAVPPPAPYIAPASSDGPAAGDPENYDAGPREVVPSTWASLLVFGLFVAPGLLFDLLAARRRTGLPESTFHEISRVVLASTAFSAIGIGAVVLIHLSRPGWVPDPRRALLEPKPYLVDNLGRLTFAIVVQVGVACLAALAGHDVGAWGSGSS